MSDVLISADCHLLEPPGLFSARVPKRLQDDAVRVNLEGNYFQLAVGDKQIVTFSRYIRGEGDELNHETIVEQRLRDLDADGVWGEVVHPNVGTLTFRLTDNEAAFAHARVYNDFAVEMLGAHFDRHKPTAIIPLTDVGDAVAEVERVAALGFRALLAPPYPPSRYATTKFDPVWAAAQAHGLTVFFHVGGAPLTPNTGAPGRTLEEIFTRNPDTVHADRLKGAALDPMVAQAIIADLVGGGACERFPELHFVTTEFNAYWLAGLMMGMDKAYTLGIGQDVSEAAMNGIYDYGRAANDQPMMLPQFRLNDAWPYPLRPSDYVRRQIHCTFQDDPGALANRHYTGIEPLLWGSDYPHHEACWPRTQDCLTTQFAEIPADERAAITGGTLGALLGFAAA